MYPRLRSLKFVFEVVFVIFLISFLTLAFPFLEAWKVHLEKLYYLSHLCISTFNLFKKPSKNAAMWWLKAFNFGLGCLGTILSVMLM